MKLNGQLRRTKNIVNKKTIKACLALLLSFMSACFSYSQNLEFTRYTTKEGLLTDAVYNLHQDRSGYIWLFTRYGAMKYNGTRFKPVLTNLPIHEAFIYAFYENEKGEKWVASSGANIYAVKNDSVVKIKGFEKTSEYLNKTVSEISRLYVDDSSNIFIYTKGPSYKFVKTKTGFSPIEISKATAPDSVSFRVINNGNQLGITRRYTKYQEPEVNKYLLQANLNGKDYLIEVPGQKLVLPNLSVPPRNIKQFNGNTFFLYSSLLYRISDNSVRVTNLKSVGLNFIRDQRGHLWVGCLNDGLYELDRNDSVVAHYLNNVTVNDVLIDHQGGLWASTPGQGLFYCNNLSGKCFQETDPLGLSINNLKPIRDALLITNIKGEIYVQTGNRKDRIREADNNTPFGLLYTNGELLISFSNGLEKYIPSRRKIIKLPGSIKPCYSIVSIGNDSLIYCSRRGITLEVRGRIVKTIDLDHKIHMAEYYEGRLWFATDEGVYALDILPQTFAGPQLHAQAVLSIPKMFEKCKGAVVSDIIKDEAGSLWFCSQGGGLYHYNGNGLVVYNQEGGLPSNIVNHMSFTSNRSALISTNKGLFISRTERGDGTYTGWQRLYNGEVQKSEEYDDKIYLGTRTGLIVLDNEQVNPDNSKFFLNLAGIRVNSEAVNMQNFRELKPDASSVEFEFDLIDFSHANANLRYTLSGAINEQGQATGHIIKLNRLEPGSYELTVFCEKIDGGESLSVSIPFTKQAAFWQTTAFRIGAIIGLLILVSLVVVLIIRYYRNKEVERSEIEKTISEYKLIALKAQINPHFMSNCLSAIQLLILDNKTEKAVFYLSRFGLLVRRMLDFSTVQLITLQEELDILGIYLQLEELRFENKFQYTVHFSDNVDARNIYVPPLILNPLLENAIWHGLLPVQFSRKGSITIKIGSKNKLLYMAVEDNGAGRRNTKKGQSGDKGNSYGIQITEQRLKNINHIYNTGDASIQYEDLMDGGGAPAGTIATIYLPLDLNPESNE